MSNIPFLPAELERQIIELAAFHSPQTAARLMLVSQRMRLWAEPILYSVFRLDDWRKPYPPCYSKGTGSKANSLDSSILRRYGQHIRYLYIQGKSAKTITKILGTCPNVESLTMWMIGGSDDSLVTTLESLPLRKLSIHAVDLLLLHGEKLPGPPLSLNLTHLNLLEVHDFGGIANWQTITILPNLTHLGLNGTPTAELVEYLLCECRKLEWLVVVWPRGKKQATESPSSDRVSIADTRLVQITSNDRCGDFWKQEFPDFRTIYDEDGFNWERSIDTLGK